MTAPPVSGIPSVVEPARLALQSWLGGGPVARPDPMRYLQLACGDGASLLALAFYHPESHFVGIDSSRAAIVAARAAADAIGVENLRFEQTRPCALPPAAELGGRFDYIFADELYAWVDSAEQDALLSSGDSHLGANGLFCIGFELPGGRSLVPAVRALVAGLGERAPGDAVNAARAAARALLGLDGEAKGPYRQMLARELSRLVAADDVRLRREYLAGEIEPDRVAASEMRRRAAAHGLAYVADAVSYRGELGARQRIGVQAELEQLGVAPPSSDDLVDHLTGDRRRRGLFCRATDTGPRLDLRGLPELYVASGLMPATTPINYHPDAEVLFVTKEGRELNVKEPVLKGLLAHAHVAYPKERRLGELFADSVALLSKSNLELANREGALEQVGHNVIELHVQGAIELRLSPAPRPAPAIWKPHALTRHELARGSTVTTGDLLSLEVEPFERHAMIALGECADTDAAIHRLVGQAVAGELAVEQHGIPIREPGKLEELLRPQVGALLAQMAQAGLLA